MLKQIICGDLIKPKMAGQGGYLMECCDCGLVHRLDFTLNLNDEEIDPDKVRLELRVYRDEEKTAQARAAAPYDPPAKWLHKR